MKKILAPLLIVLLVVSVVFNIRQYVQLKDIKEKVDTVSNEIDVIKTTMEEKDTLITDKEKTITELENTIEKLQKQIEELKEQIASLEIENEELAKQLKEKGSTTGGTGNTPTTSTANNPVPSSEGQLSDTEVNRLLEQYGIVNGGNGGGRP